MVVHGMVLQQCSGVTLKGARCARKLRSTADDYNTPSDIYCASHYHQLYPFVISRYERKFDPSVYIIFALWRYAIVYNIVD